MNEVERLQIELDTMKRTADEYAAQLRARDLAAVPEVPEVNYRLQYAQKAVDQTLAEPRAVEELRVMAWLDWSLSPDSPAGSLYKNAPRDGSWPEGMTELGFIRKFQGLNEDGTALLGEKVVEEEAKALSPWLEAALNKARGGK